MRPLTKEAKLEIATRPQVCERYAVFHDHICRGRLTVEHAFRYAGKQIDDPWALVLLCEFAHSVGPYQDIGILDKRLNEWLALGRATEEDLEPYPMVNWRLKHKNLGRYIKGRYVNHDKLL